MNINTIASGYGETRKRSSSIDVCVTSLRWPQVNLGGSKKKGLATRLVSARKTTEEPASQQLLVARSLPANFVSGPAARHGRVQLRCPVRCVTLKTNLGRESGQLAPYIDFPAGGTQTQIVAVCYTPLKRRKTRRSVLHIVGGCECAFVHTFLRVWSIVCECGV